LRCIPSLVAWFVYTARRAADQHLIVLELLTGYRASLLETAREAVTVLCQVMAVAVPSLRQERFVSTPLQDLDLESDVPGVGPVSFQKLTDANIKTVTNLVGQFMILDCDEQKMGDWLTDVAELRSLEAKKVTTGLTLKANILRAV